MAQITKEITVDVAKKNLFQAIVAKQNDNNSRFLKVTLCNEGVKIEVPSTATALINAERADNSSKAFAGTVNADGTVTVPLTNWMLGLDDVVRCSISVIGSDEQKLTSTSFSLDVEAAEYEGSDITEDENYDILITLISDVSDAKLACETATTAANSATDLAQRAASSANSAATSATSAAENANTAATAATNAATGAETSASNANTATANANAAATAANTAAGNANTAAAEAKEISDFYGSPLVATTAAAMTKTNRVYVYAGTETGYTKGHWYYYNGTKWVDGGTYNSATVDGCIVTDTDNNKSYLMKFRLVNGKPVIEYNENAAT